MAVLVKITWNIDTRIEPYFVTREDYEKITGPFVQKIINIGKKQKH